MVKAMFKKIHPFHKISIITNTGVRFHLRGALAGRTRDHGTATADGCRSRFYVSTTADPQRDRPGYAAARHQHIPSTNIISIHDGTVGVTDLGVMLLWSSADNGI